MKLPEHISLSFLLAQFGIQQEYGLLGTGLVVAAGCLPDLDGLGIVFGWRFYQRHHRILGHGLPVTLAGPALLALLGSWLLDGAAFWTLWFWCQGALLLHLCTDVCFYDWPVQLLWPLSRHGWGLGLIAWNDLVPTLLLYGTTALAILWPAQAVPAAAAGTGGLIFYLAWRALKTPSQSWAIWLTGGWAKRSKPIWRWLTGDFVT
jgi:membrane-bound metal-dependent hydrolase YbcI (DUF457 family)